MITDRTSRVGKVLAILYMLIFVSLSVYFFVVSPENSEFAGVYFIFLALPWSLALVGITLALDSLGHPDAIPTSVTFILLAVAATMNFRWLYARGSGRAKTDTLEQRERRPEG